MSEATGQIALSLDGRIERGLSTVDLLARLRSLVVRRASRLIDAHAYDL